LHFAVFMRLLILEDILYVELALKNWVCVQILYATCVP
jgi:hypothetical protein